MSQSSNEWNFDTTVDMTGCHVMTGVDWSHSLRNMMHTVNISHEDSYITNYKDCFQKAYMGGMKTYRQQS